MLHRLLVIVAIALLVGCEKSESESAANNGDGSPSMTKVSLQLNWKAEPQFGGFYAAQFDGEFAKRGLDVTIREGGAGVPTIQMIGAGSADFAIVSGDELVIARTRGIDAVALFAVYQTNPQGLMTPAKRGFKSIDDIFKTPGTLAIERGLPYAQYLEKKFGFDQLSIIPSPYGDLTQLRLREQYAMQCFVTSEPIAAKKIGLDVSTFLIADAGWNPYTTVLAARREYVEKNPELARKVIEAVRVGWENYLADSGRYNSTMAKLNPTMDLETFSASAAAQLKLIKPDDATEVGSMTIERWKQLVADLKSLGLIDSEPAAETLIWK